MSLGREDDQMKAMLAHQDPETRKELDKTLAAISQKLMPMAGKVLQGIPPIVQQAMQMMQASQPQPQIPVDPNVQMQIEAKTAADDKKLQAEQQSDAMRFQDKEADRGAKRETAQLRLVELDKKLTQAKELTFAQLSAKERQQAVDAANNDARRAQEYAARLQELQLREVGDDQRTAAELSSREQINKEDNLTALAIAEAEIESGEKVSVETGTGINPSA